MTNQQVVNALDNLKLEFPHKKFWNHDPSLEYDQDNPDHPKIITSSPCTHHHTTGCSNYGTCGCNSFYNGIQCFGFALYMAYRVFGHYPRVREYDSQNGGSCGNGWIIYYNAYIPSDLTLEPGDVIRMSGHSAIVHTVNGDEVKVAEVWGNPENENLTCQIRWGYWEGHSTITASYILANATYIVKAPKTAPTPVTVSFGFRDGGVNPTVTRQVYPGSTYGTVPYPEVEHEFETFIGWWDHVLDQIKEYDGDTVVTATTDHTLYAHWGFPIKLTNVGANKCLNINGDNLTSLSNGINVTLWSDSGTNEQRWLVKSVGTQRVVKSVIDPRFGLNVYRSGSPYNCNIYKTCGNETDALVNFISLGNGVLKIKLTNYDLYLTAASTANGANVYWGAASDSDLQKWTFESY